MIKRLAKAVLLGILGGALLTLAVVDPLQASLTFPFAIGVVSIATVLRRGNILISDVTATVDADTTATIPHGMDGAVKMVTIVPLLQAPAAVSEWAVTTQDGTNIVLTKGTGVGSGNAGAQLRVFIEKLGG
ncbi:MAG: hypothetical protein L0212_04125 [Acidobacteria bacterium]|nr:hypothetical protein [Acidobacteriota bacterium]